MIIECKFFIFYYKLKQPLYFVPAKLVLPPTTHTACVWTTLCIIVSSSSQNIITKEKLNKCFISTACTAVPNFSILLSILYNSAKRALLGLHTGAVIVLYNTIADT